MKKVYRRTSSRSFNRSLMQQVGHVRWNDHQPAPCRTPETPKAPILGASRIVVIPPVREVAA
jgi:hypothetical protein